MVEHSGVMMFCWTSPCGLLAMCANRWLRQAASSIGCSTKQNPAEGRGLDFGGVWWSLLT